MTKFQNTFDRKVWKIVSEIPCGHVMSYGDIARAAGYPRHARMVSRAMSRSVELLPWYRVVRADRTLAFAIGSEAYNKQKKLLKKEGVKIINKKVVLIDTDIDKNLDEILWAPPS